MSIKTIPGIPQPRIDDKRIPCIISVRNKPFTEESCGFEVIGYPVHIPGYEPFSFAVHPTAQYAREGGQTVSTEEFSVSELSSGRKIGCGETIEEAALDALNRLIHWGITPDVLRAKLKEVTATQA